MSPERVRSFTGWRIQAGDPDLFILVIGVSGRGMSSGSRMLAHKLGWPFTTAGLFILRQRLFISVAALMSFSKG